MLGLPRDDTLEGEKITLGLLLLARVPPTPPAPCRWKQRLNTTGQLTQPYSQHSTGPVPVVGHVWPLQWFRQSCLAACAIARDNAPYVLTSLIACPHPNRFIRWKTAAQRIN